MRDRIEVDEDRHLSLFSAGRFVGPIHRFLLTATIDQCTYSGVHSTDLTTNIV